MSGRLGALVGAVTLVAVGCGGHGGAPTHPGQDAATTFDARDAEAGGLDAKVDRAGPEAACGDAGTKKAAGQACACASECSSNFCVDGVCCGTACAESCKTCAAPGSPGTCTFAIAGAKPRDATACASADPSTCGFDGTCDGAGACRRFVAGTVCKKGACSGDAVVGAFACDGAGRCKPGPTTICAPYSCDPTQGACFAACTVSSQCVAGQQCVNASCGKKMKGASCAKNADCASGFCADGLCCNVACQGGCLSCALPDRLGTCWPIDQGVADPRGVCVDQGAPSCGSTGTCDGFGGCTKYAPETICIAASCTGTRRNTPGTCDGLGTCRPQGVQNCSPFLCAGGACTQACASDADCDAGHACVNGRCGLENLGQPCGVGTECLSGICAEGVCCDDACGGACRSCALASTMGHCTPLAAGAVDSKNVCIDEGATTCGENGRCDGSGGCQRYKEGTVCAPESCSGNVYTPGSTCSATGQCTPPDSLPCAPYVCNGNSCFSACTTDQNCVSPNTCNDSSCGEKAIGASCSASNECQSTFCAQGVCCNAACAGACTSCALPGSLGTCTNVPNDASDPAGLCADQGAASCGTNGKCQAGACQKYAHGTACEDSTCPSSSTTFTPGSTCDGQGACVTPAASSCFPFQCGVNVCDSSCTTDAECAAPAVCTNGSCGLKGIGQTCADTTECMSGFCAQGVCCDGACSGTCQSCVLSGSLGHCANIADGGTDPRGRCADNGSAACGTDGACDGKGACRIYAAGTACMAASCAAGASTLTQTRTCDGAGACKPATTQSCSPYLCNGVSACKAACTVDADCVLPNICDPQTNLCGNKRRLGQTCALTTDCLTGNFCVDGVCCASSMCGLCQTCATGACANVGAGTPEPPGGCAANPPCGNTGNCNGGGACEQAGTSVACGTASCAGTTFSPVSKCTGGGSCAAPMTSSCSPYVCGAAACKTTCASDADCVAPFTCQGAGANRSCALKPNGAVCAQGNQCITGNCVDGTCCGSATCSPCQACNVNGLGSCAPVAAGTTAPTTFCATQDPSTCGTNGKCDGGGGCQKYPDNTGCAPKTCAAGTATLKAAGVCSLGSCSVATTSCAPYFCDGAQACLATCDHDADCATGYYCTGTGGSCAMKGNAGDPCTNGAGDQCNTGFCTDGVCCGSAACGTCQACNVSGHAGTCSPLGAGAADPTHTCVDNLAASCGTDGKCDGAGGCQKYADNTPCAPASCPAMTSTLIQAGTCQSGSCSQPPKSCGAFACNGATDCRATCAGDGDCAPGNYCINLPVGSCTPKLDLGKACGPMDECKSGNYCTDGFCCTSSACGTCQACNATGSCQNTDGATCTTTDKCHAATGTCASGSCSSAAISCDDGNPCTVDSCNPSTGCAHALATNGTACDDGNACTQTDTCQAGACAGGNPVTCAAFDQCHVAGTCNPATGVCSNPNKADGAPCSDGNACTQTDTCLAGACSGANPVTCGALDQCHVPGTCTPATGVCSNPNQTDGTACSDGNACTQTDICQAGICAGGNPVVCTASDQCHAVGTCDPASGFCSNPALADGTACDDGNVCTQTDTCLAGTCAGTNPVVCTASDQCHAVGTCDTTSGCSNPTLADGTACSDGNACTQTDTCLAGACAGANPVVCAASDQCHAAGTCDPTSGCSNPTLADGTACSDDNACTDPDICVTGSCQPGPAVVDGTTCSDDNACTDPDTCVTGICQPGPAIVCSDPQTCDTVTGLCM